VPYRIAKQIIQNLRKPVGITQSVTLIRFDPKQERIKTEYLRTFSILKVRLNI
jgi:hypothetical protein